LSRKAALVTELLQEQGKLMGWTGTAQNGYSIPKDAFFAAPGALRVWELMRLYDSLKLSSSPRRLAWRFLSPVLENWLPQGTVVRGHGVELLVRKSNVVWQRCIVMPCKRSYFIEVSAAGTYSVPEVGVRISFVRCSGKGSPVARQMELRARDIEWPLVLRSRRRGDEILLERGTTSLKELFAGWTLPEGQRQLIPVLADRKGVVAVLGRAFGYPDRMRVAAQAPHEGETDRIIVRADR
jgi:tRNA(Ile)-lysidine synthetase-like protein